MVKSIADTLPDAKIGCHRTGFTKKCRKLVAGGICHRWLTITMGKKDGTGEQATVSDCIDHWMFRLAQEQVQATDQVSADVQGMRNVTVKMVHALATGGPTALTSNLEQILDLELGQSKPTIRLEDKS